jgi:hypothetical protein
MLHIYRFAVAISLIIFDAGSALAQEISAQIDMQQMLSRGATPEFMRWLAGKGHERKPDIERNLKEQIEKRPVECKDISFGSAWTFAMFRPITVNAAGDVESGVWREGYEVVACGIKRQLNIIYIAENGTLKSVAGMPGSSIADPILQRDAGMAFYARGGKDCKQAFALDTKFMGYTDAALDAKPGQPQRSWREDWTLWACGKEIVVPFTFTPNARGTQWMTMTLPEKR